MKKIWFTGCILLLTTLFAPSAFGQTGLAVYDRLQEQRDVYPLERVYVHTDAEDYLQGDRIWLKAYLVDEIERTPVDSTLYLYVELFDKHGYLARRAKLLRNQGAFFGYLDIPEDLTAGEAYLRAYTRYMASAPETAFTKRISVGRTKVSEPVPSRSEKGLAVERRPHGFRLRYPGKESCYLVALRGGQILYLGSVGRNRTVLIPDEALGGGPLDFLVLDRGGTVVSRKDVAGPPWEDRLELPVTLDKTAYLTDENVSVKIDPTGLREGELLDLSVSVTCRPLIRRHFPASIADYVSERSLGFDYSPALSGKPVTGEKEATAALTGSVQSILLGRPIPDARVCLISPQTGLLDVCQSGPDGRFRIEGLDYPAGTTYLVKSTDQKGRDRFDLVLDEEAYPPFRIPYFPYATAPDDTLEVVYAPDDNPFGTIALEAAGVSATVDGPPPVGFNRLSDYVVTLRQIEERGYSTLYELLQEVPSVFFREGRAYIRATVSIDADVPAALAVDGTILDGEFDLDVIRMPDVARVDIFKTGRTVLWGSKGGGGVISVTTKAGNLDVELLNAGETAHTKVRPLGYQPPSDFLTAAQYRNRRTVYWNPLLLADSFAFTLGDNPGTYLLVIEGVTSDGRLVHEERTFEVSQ